MRFALLCLVGLCALAAAEDFSKPARYHKRINVDGEWAKKQYEILRFFKYVQQQTYYKDQYATAKSYNIGSNYAAYQVQEPVKELMYYYQRGMLPRGEIFSVFYEQQLKEAIALFRTFYYAKDWDTFWKTACWARVYVNEGQFVYALSLAVVHRPDFKNIILPPIYEIMPYYFFPTETIYEAQKYKQAWSGTYRDQSSSYPGYTVASNYSGWYMNLHPEQSMSYWTEDVRINAYYYYYNLYYPFWMESKEYGIYNQYRGEQYYYVHQQLLARYYAERISGDFGEIPTFSWDGPFETGYYPSLRYPNGMEFPQRPSNAYLFKRFVDGEQSGAFYYKNYTYSLTYIRDYERRIRDAIDRGFIWTEDGKVVNLYDKKGFEYLGNLIQSNPDSPNTRFYGDLQSFARFVLGYSYYPLGQYKAAPSALEHFETSLRDPAFYQYYKKVTSYFYKYKNYLPAYKYEELNFPGVKIVEADVPDLTTYFDYYYYDLSNAVYVNEKEFQEDSFQVRTQQQRLTYKPFEYKVKVQSDKAVRSMVRVYIGPKYDEYGREFNMTYNRYNFFEFDKFIWDLKSGSNEIVRPYTYSWYSYGSYSFQELFKMTSAVREGKAALPIYQPDYYYNWPSQYMIPSGSPEGTYFQFYFIVTPYQPTDEVKGDDYYYPYGFNQAYYDKYPLGYPFNRPIYDEHTFWVDNSYVVDTQIFHKSLKSINAPHH